MIRSTFVWIALPGAMLLSGTIACAQTTPVTPIAPPAPSTPRSKPCIASEHRQFDFWLGDWDVTTPDGKPSGTNSIKPILGGCVLHENWHGSGGFTGQSFNAYDVKRKVWHQTWVDGTGGLLLLEGRYENGAMTLSDKGMPGKPDANAINEIAWTVLADGAVRQLWRTSSDGGKSWATSFDGKYVRAQRDQPAPFAK
jgi:hypothetical protein